MATTYPTDAPADDAGLVAYIRTICAGELNRPAAYDFFHLCREDGETPDEALLRIFREERPHHDTDVDTVLVLCHG